MLNVVSLSACEQLLLPFTATHLPQKALRWAADLPDIPTAFPPFSSSKSCMDWFHETTTALRSTQDRLFYPINPRLPLSNSAGSAMLVTDLDTKSIPCMFVGLGLRT